MELRVLNYFLTVAREGGLTGASEVLHVTQPTMSRQIQELEEELGQKLFIRTTRSMVLTPEGMLLRKRAEEILEMAERTKAEFSSMGTSAFWWNRWMCLATAAFAFPPKTPGV